MVTLHERKVLRCSVGVVGRVSDLDAVAILYRMAILARNKVKIKNIIVQDITNTTEIQTGISKLFSGSPFRFFVLVTSDMRGDLPKNFSKCSFSSMSFILIEARADRTVAGSVEAN